MSRNKAFRHVQPFAGHENISLDHETVRGALNLFNPTQARFELKDLQAKHPELVDKQQDEKHVRVPGAILQWRSRNNRKGRHALLVDRSHPASTATARAIGRGLLRMATECPYWDVSYLIAVSFTIGSLTFIVSGLFYWLPLEVPSSTFPKETTVAGGVTSFVGATLFQIGAIFLVLESFNANQTGCFGWALHRSLTGDEPTTGDAERGGVVVKRDYDSCQHHHQRERRKHPSGAPDGERKWKWYPSWNEVKTHYIHEIGFVANMILATGATLFYITGICGLPGIYENMSLGLARGLFWLMYLLGGVFFVVSSALYMLETQPTWYTPAPHLLGWHIGFWNMVGSVGWTLAASWGYCTSDMCVYQSELTLIWASAAFFIGSALQWYEASEKYPVDTKS